MAGVILKSFIIFIVTVLSSHVYVDGDFFVKTKVGYFIVVGVIAILYVVFGVIIK